MPAPLGRRLAYIASEIALFPGEDRGKQSLRAPDKLSIHDWAVRQFHALQAGANAVTVDMIDIRDAHPRFKGPDSRLQWPCT
jgi:hypothetical protein